jgi:hypothetical protein
MSNPQAMYFAMKREKKKNAELRAVLQELHEAAGKRMMADEPDAEQMLRFMAAWKRAGDVLKGGAQ